MIERKVVEQKPRVKRIYYYWGLTWPTLIIGAITVMSIAVGSAWIIKLLVAAAADDPNF